MIGNRGELYSADDTVLDWVNRNGADLVSVDSSFADIDSSDGSNVTKHEFLNGDGGTTVVLYSIDGGGHSEPSIQFPYVNPQFWVKQNGDIEMAEEIWSFFKNKSK